MQLGRRPKRLYIATNKLAWGDNFSAYVLEEDSVLYYTPEHYYQCGKLKYGMDQQRVREARNPWKAKETARQIICNFPDSKVEGWDQKKLAHMEKTLRLKIAQHPEVLDTLLATGDAILLEATSHLFWKKELGGLWMMLRAEERARRVRGK